MLSARFIFMMFWYLLHAKTHTVLSLTQNSEVDEGAMRKLGFLTPLGRSACVFNSICMLGDYHAFVVGC